MKNIEKRFWEIDFLRGIAIVMMIIFHLLFDLYYFGGYEMSLSAGFWLYFARATAGIFIFLVGVSLFLSSERAKKMKTFSFLKYLKRGIKIFSWGILITIITWTFLDRGTIIFGILHFIGISIIIAYPFILKIRKERTILISLILVLFAKVVFDLIDFGNYYTAWLGLPPVEFYSLDFFPLIPWFALILIGIYAGNLMYKNYERLIDIPDISQTKIVKMICALGKNALLIYLIHQPILIAFLHLIGVIVISI